MLGFIRLLWLEEDLSAVIEDQILIVITIFPFVFQVNPSTADVPFVYLVMLVDYIDLPAAVSLVPTGAVLAPAAGNTWNGRCFLLFLCCGLFISLLGCFLPGFFGCFLFS